MTTEKLREITKCLYCPIGKAMISTYLEYYQLHQKIDVDCKKNIQILVKKMVELLHLDFDFSIPGKDEDADNFLLGLSRVNNHIPYEKKIPGSDVKILSNYYCISNLNKIISAIVDYHNADSPEQSIELLNSDSALILQEMQKIYDRVIEYGLSKKPEKRGKLFFYLISDFYSDSNREVSGRRRNYSFFDLINDYLDNETPYRYCDPDEYYNDVFVKYQKKGVQLRSCQADRFLDAIRTISTSEQNNVSLDYHDLSGRNQTVFETFIRHAPKEFGVILTEIMLRKELTENDIAIFVEKQPNRIQALKKCKQHKQSDNEIKKLCRALLVTPEVLYSGVGKSYGTWRTLLNEASYRNDSEKSLDRKPETGKVTKKQRMAEIREVIKHIIGMSDDEFEETIRNYPELFPETEINIFIQEDGIEDFNYMYKSALHPEEITLLHRILTYT